MLGAIGSPLMTAAIPAMTRLTTAFNDLSEAATKNPTTTGIIATTLAGSALGSAAGFVAGWLPAPLAPVTVPLGTAGGGLIGGAMGLGYGIYNQLPESMQKGLVPARVGPKVGYPARAGHRRYRRRLVGGAAGFFGGPSKAGQGPDAFNVVPRRRRSRSSPRLSR